MDIIENEKNVQYFLDLIKKSRRGIIRKSKFPKNPKRSV